MTAAPMSKAANWTSRTKSHGRLGFDQHGLAKVRLELLEVPSRQRTMERAD